MLKLQLFGASSRIALYRDFETVFNCCEWWWGRQSALMSFHTCQISTFSALFAFTLLVRQGASTNCFNRCCLFIMIFYRNNAPRERVANMPTKSLISKVNDLKKARLKVDLRCWACWIDFVAEESSNEGTHRWLYELNCKLAKGTSVFYQWSLRCKRAEIRLLRSWSAFTHFRRISVTSQHLVCMLSHSKLRACSKL